MRSFDQSQFLPLADTERGSTPFFSPDGRWIGFVADGKLKKIGLPTLGSTSTFIPSMSGPCWGIDSQDSRVEKYATVAGSLALELTAQREIPIRLFCG